MSRSNSAIIRKAYEDFARGDIPAVFAVFDASITWHVPGHSHAVRGFSRTRSGRWFLPAHDGGFPEVAFSIDVHNVLAKGDLVIVLGNRQRTTKRGFGSISRSARLENEGR